METPFWVNHFLKNRKSLKMNNLFFHHNQKNGRRKAGFYRVAARMALWAGLFVAGFSGLNAQPLDTLLAHAADNNLELKALYQDYLAALEKAPQVGQLPDPEVMAGVFVLPVETRVGPQWVRLGATQMFPWKGTLKAREEVVLAMAKARFEKIEATRLNLFYEVKKAWLALYELEKSKDIIRRNIQIFESMQRLALAKVESGKGSSADVLRIQLKLQELNTELALLDIRSKKPLAALNQVLNRPLDTPVRFEDSLALAVIPYNRDTLAAYLTAEHPLIRMYNAQQETARNAMHLNALEGKPSFGVGMDYIVVGKRKNVELSDNGKDILSPRVGVKIPLFRQKYAAKDREESLKIAALEYRKEDARNRFLAEIEKAWADRDDAARSLGLYDELIRTTRAAIRILEADYSTAGRNFDELLRLRNELVNYDLKILKAVVKSHLAKAKIEQFIP
ncbi:MAG: TolC family protein [Bacteroidetes bacterium]|nr:MAG: TolC family protein [Bacteroidota bacterium]